MSRNISSLWIGTIWEQFYDAAVNNFDAAMKYISKHGLQEAFQSRIDTILNHCESSGRRFPDEMWSVYEEYNSKG